MLLTCLVSLQATAPDAQRPRRRRRQPGRELVAQPESPARSSASASSPTTRTRASPGPSTSASSSPTPWATTPCSSTPTSSSPRAGWLDRMRERTDTEGRPAAVVGARLLYPNGLIQHAGVFFSLLNRDWLHRYRFGPANLPEALKPTRCIVTGALQFIRWETLDQIGLYDEGYRLCFEDVDYCLRVFKAGLECIYEPSVVAMHHESFFRRNATPKIERWTAESDRRACGRCGAPKTCPAGFRRRCDGDPQDAVPVARQQGPRLVPLRAARPRAGRRLDVLRRRAAERPLPARPHRPPADVADVPDYDVVVIQQPRGAEWLGAIRDWQRAGVIVLADIDDWLRGIRKRTDHDFNAAFGRKTIEELELCMRAVDGIICSTPWLAERYASLNPRTYVCRNGIDLKRYALTRPERDYVGIGWSGAHRPHDRHAAVARADRAVMRERDDVHFVSVGQRFAHDLAPEFGAAALRRDPVLRAGHLPRLDDAVRHRPRPGRRQQLLPRQERPALARGERHRAAADRRPGRLPRHRARRHRLPRLDPGRDGRDRARAGGRRGAAPPRRRSPPRRTSPSTAARRSPPSSGPTCCARSPRPPSPPDRDEPGGHAQPHRAAAVAAHAAAAGGDRSDRDDRDRLRLRPPGRHRHHRGGSRSQAGGTPAGQAMLAAVPRRGRRQAEQPPGSNDSPRIAQYRQATAGAPGPGPWCAYFVSWAARQAGVPIGDSRPGLRPRRRRVGLGPSAPARRCPAGTAPQPGDLIVWDEHIGIVESVGADGSINTIEGNSSDSVARRTYGTDGGGAVGYVRLG